MVRGSSALGELFQGMIDGGVKALGNTPDPGRLAVPEPLTLLRLGLSGCLGVGLHPAIDP